ncbi:MAG: M20/M25/M40 family metallo-hydrolase [Chitinophagaceae bacterium]
MVLRTQLLSLVLLLCFNAFSQRKSVADKTIVENLRTHISYLADDRLEGRRMGTKGEALAQNYIIKAFTKDGLQPRGDNGSFLQNFSIREGRFYQNKSYLIINEDSIPASGFFPFPQSPEASIKIKCSVALKEIGVPWFLDLKEDLQAALANPHFDFSTYISDKAKIYGKKGASAIFAYNSDFAKPDLLYDARSTGEALAIPVIFISEDLARKYFSDETATLRFKFTIGFADSVRTGGNVIGFIDNGAPTTIVLGAHFDHIGYGEDGNSLLHTGEKLIHNGADDNASGVAAIIELGRILKGSNLKKNNYLFIAFSGEESGMLGSKFFADHPTIDLHTANYMFNFDMVGRLDKDKKTIVIGGYGTSPAWSQTFKKVKDKALTPKFDSSGAGPSDHTSFYRKDLPVIFFFTGTHDDYHKPTDDIEKINYDGESKLITYVIRLIKFNNKSGKIPFTKTREIQMENTTPFAVTMGIRPDYAFEGSGVRIDGVSDGRPAQKAGLLSGDIIVELGPHAISSLQSYMEALGKFKPGEAAKVKVKRKTEVVVATINF